MKPLFFLVSFFSFSYLSAQSFSDNVWYTGKAILSSEDTVYGSIRYDLATNLLEVESQTVKAYSARQISAFEIDDVVNKQRRYFYALPYSESTYKVPTFFELLTKGHIGLLCRESSVTESVPLYNYYGYRTNMYTTRKRRVYEFYFAYENGERIKRYRGTKKDFYFLIKDHADDLKGFIKEEKLAYDDKADLMKIITYYNSLKK